jgi:amino acid transporter
MANASEEEMAALAAAFPEPTRRLEFLYANLSVLDSKASSLMAFNAIGLTALAVWLESIPSNWLHLALDIVFLLFLFSSATCLVTVWVYWSPPHHFGKPVLQTKALLEKRNRRTRLYRVSWVLSSLAVAVLTVVSLIHAIGTALYASGGCGERCQAVFSEGKWGNRNVQPPSEPRSGSRTSSDPAPELSW